MKLDYGTQLSPEPIKLSIGTLVKPKLSRISKITFEKFNYYEMMIKMTPKFFYTKIKGSKGKKYWESLSEAERENLNLYNVVIDDKQLTNIFVEIFNFFFEENVIFQEDYFILFKKNLDSDTASKDNIAGVISKNIFSEVLDVIQQVCCIKDEEEEDVDNMKFKNGLAKRMFEKMQKAAKEEQERKKASADLELPNIISSVSNKHFTISPINVWELTIFQLMDAFNRLQLNTVFDINSTRVSVWGDEKRTFNAALWYKNEYDKKQCLT